MRPVKIYLISPREPSGATWLINCLLELGVKTYRATVGHMWEGSNKAGYKLNPMEGLLKKWLPILSRKDHFYFRDDVEVEWAHHWPDRRHQGHRILYFVRDPRDALFSRYRREAPEMGFGEFLDFPDPLTLRNKIDTWNLFGEVWLEQQDVKVFRFEDYKRDPRWVLTNILQQANIRADEQQILGALENSTSEKAAEAELRYREQHPDDLQTINRGGQVGAWRSSGEAAQAIRIGERSQALLTRFGYESHPKTSPANYLPHSRILDFYRRLPVEPKFWRPELPMEHASAQVEQIVRFALNLDENTIKKSRIPPGDVQLMLQGLLQLVRGRDQEALRNIKDLSRRYRAKPSWIVARLLERHNMRMPLIAEKIYRSLRKVSVGE